LKVVLIDTGAIVALLDRSERHHQPCVEALNAIAAPLVTCEAVIAESCYLLRRMRGAADAVLENVASGVFQIPLRLSECAPEVRRVMRKYRDRGVDLADACLVQLAGAIGSGDILTLDRDFDVYRWGANQRFRRLIRWD
jgi:uncharacterized protein